MTDFAVFALYLCFSVTILVVAPVMMHPTLPARRKLIIGIASFIILVPLGLVLYAFVGAPKMSVF